MAASRVLPARPSLESFRKQARKLSRDIARGDAAAVTRARAQLPAASSPLSLRDAQLVIAREFGFAGWRDLVAEVMRRMGRGLDVVATEAARVIHDNDTARLRQLLDEHPGLVSWRDERGRNLLPAAASSFGDSGDPSAEERFTRLECAAILLDAGIEVDERVLRNVTRARAHHMLQLLERKHAVPQTIEYRAALGDLDAVRRLVDDPGSAFAEATADQASERDALFDRAFMNACRFQRTEVAAFLLERSIALHPELGTRVDSGPGRAKFIESLGRRHVHEYGSPWQTFVMDEILRAIDGDDLTAFERWLTREPYLLGPQAIDLQVAIIERASYGLQDRERFVRALFERDPAILRASPPPKSEAIYYALEYDNTHLLPLLTRLWPVPDDLPYAAGTGDFDRVRSWFDAQGKPNLGDLRRHHPANHPPTRGNLQWGEPTVQQVLDVALAWACINRHLDIAAFLLEHGADVNTTWSSHEPASILHELVWHENYESMQFLIDHGIDVTTRDYRWDATAEGWARVAAKNDRMGDFIAEAARAKQARQGS